MVTEHEAALAEPITQAAFRAWLDQRPDAGRGHYELLNGRIVVSPPAGWPQAQIEVNVTLALREHAVDPSPTRRTVSSSASADRQAASPRPIRSTKLSQ